MGSQVYPVQGISVATRHLPMEASTPGRAAVLPAKDRQFQTSAPRLGGRRIEQMLQAGNGLRRGRAGLAITSWRQLSLVQTGQ